MVLKKKKKKELGSDGKKIRGWQGRKTLENRAEQKEQTKQPTNLIRKYSMATHHIPLQLVHGDGWS